MHWKSLACWSSVASFGYAAPLAPNASETNIVPRAYIVEFTDDYNVNTFMRTAESSEVEVRRRLEYELFKGVSIEVKNDTDLDTAVNSIASISQVKNVWPVRTFPILNDTVHWTGNDRNAASKVLKKRQSTNESDAFAPHVMTQVDRLHEEGVKGKGIRIAIIDSGIDYNHPALGGCFGPGCLVTHRSVFAGDDSEPLDCVGHGTHVAGTIAAQKNDFGFIGAAPEVSLSDYKVGDCTNIVSTDGLIAAAYQAYEDGNDIITMSLGESSGWTDEPWAAAIERIVKAGVPCTVAAGNEGSSGLFLASSPATGNGVSAIASVENSELPEVLLEGSFTTGNYSTGTFGWIEGTVQNTPDGWTNLTLPLFSNAYNTSDPNDSCKPLPSDTPDLSNYIYLVFFSGDCFLDDKIADARAHGARYFLVYDNTPTALPTLTFEPVQAIGVVSYEQGLEWEDLLSRDVKVTVSIVEPQTAKRFLTSKPNPTGGFISRFTTWGPGNRVEMKPQFSAPGGWILSTYPLHLGGYAILSGTSMATPLAAAIYALVGQVRGTLDPATIESAISSTANPNVFRDRDRAYPYLAPTAQQGAGLIQAYDAAFATTLLSISGISFNDTDHAVESANFTVKNLGSREKTYAISNIRAATGYTIATDTGYPSWFPNEMTTEGASLAFNSDEITIPAGGEVTVTVAPSPPSLDASRLPVYGGYIALNSTDGDSLSLPYLGVVGSLYKQDVIYPEGTFMQDGFGGPMLPNTSYSFPKAPINWDDPDTFLDYPLWSFSLIWHTLIERIDVIALNSSGNTIEVGGIKTAGTIEHMPVTHLSRSRAYVGTWNGQLTDGSFVPEGGYKLLFRALRTFGNPDKKEDWDSVESPTFFIDYTTE